MNTPRRIHEEAEKLRREYWVSGDIPVDIEGIIEGLGISIVPIPGLRSNGLDAHISRSMGEIYIDQEYYMSEKMAFRTRFSLAHELGHIRLHGEELQRRSAQVDSLESWIIFCVNQEGVTSVDIEADEFAGRLLVPRQDLQVYAEPQIERVRQESPVPLEQHDPDSIRAHIASVLHRKFEVSAVVIEIRLRKENIF